MILQRLFSELIPYLKAPDYKTFLKENPGARDVDKLVKLYPRVLKLSQKPEYRRFDVLYSPDPDANIVWNDWVYTEDDLELREYYPVLTWCDDYYHSDLYYHIPTKKWIEFDGDVGPKGGHAYRKPLDWVSYHLYVNYYNGDEYLNDKELEILERYYIEFCKLVGLNFETVKKGGPGIIQGRYDPKNPSRPGNKPSQGSKSKLSENLKWGAAAGGVAGYLGGGLVAKARGLKDGDPRIANTVLGGVAAGAVIGAGIGAYKHFKDKKKENDSTTSKSI